MKLNLFLCGSILSFFTTSTGFAEEISFSGEFTQGSSYSEFHYFTLEADSAVEVKVNSLCNVHWIILEGDANDDGNFEPAQLGVTDPVNETWYGVFPLAGGIESERDYPYRISLNCPDYHDGDSYGITLRYTAGASEAFTKDQEPNNNTNTATDKGSAAVDLQVTGHLGFFYNSREIYNSTARDSLDVYSVEFPTGRYTLCAQLDKTLLKLDPYLPTVSIRKPDGFDNVLYELISTDTPYEFNIVTSGTYSISTMIYTTNNYTNIPYGGYGLSITRELDLQLLNIEAEDNVCGNTEAVRGSVLNNSGTTFNGTDFKIRFELIGPQLVTYWDDVKISSFPPGTTLFTHNFAIPENLISGDYTYYFDLLECKSKDPDGSCVEWWPTINNRVNEKSSILCKPLKSNIISALILLLGPLK